MFLPTGPRWVLPDLAGSYPDGALLSFKKVVGKGAFLPLVDCGMINVTCSLGWIDWYN